MNKPAVKDNLLDESHLKFEPATSDALDAIVSLYRAAVGIPGCTWDDEYPSRETAEADLASGGLYVLRKDDRIIGAVSIVPENELDDLNCFTIQNGAREFARITILSEFRGNGYAAYILQRITQIAQNAGTTAWHILVSTTNPSAISLYRSFGFSFLGECKMYGNQYYIGEKALGV